MGKEAFTRFFNKRSAQLAAVALLSILTLVFLLQTYHKASRPMGFDLTSYLESARALFHGENPYRTGSAFPYIYPMFLALLLIPLTLVPYWFSVTIWYVVGVLSLALMLRFLADVWGFSHELKWGSHLYLPSAALCILLTPIIQNNLLNGQANFLVVLLCVLFLHSYVKRKPALAALFLALAISIKIIPGILLVFLAVRRDWRTLAMTAGLTALLCLAPWIFLRDQTWSIYAEYFRSTLIGSLNVPSVSNGSPVFFSLAGLVSYLAPAASDWPWLKPVSLLIVLAATVWLDLRACRRGLAGDTLAFASYLLAGLLILPITETHHLALMIPALFLVMLAFLGGARLTTSQGMAMTLGPCIAVLLGTSFKRGPFLFLAVASLFAFVVWIRNRESATVPQEPA